MSVPGKEENKIGGGDELWLAESGMWQLVTQTVKGRMEYIKNWSFIAVWRYLGRNKLKILRDYLHIYFNTHK